VDDKKIIELYELRSNKAIEETGKKYGKYCYTIAYNILFNASDSEETVNDTYLGAWNCIPPQYPVVLSSFLGKITRRLSIDKLRKRNSVKRGGGELPAVISELSECLSDEKHNTENVVEGNLLTEVINKFLSSLKKEERKVFLLRYFYTESIKNISKQMNFSESKVKSMLFRTRNNLKNLLTEEGFTV